MARKNKGLLIAVCLLCAVALVYGTNLSERTSFVGTKADADVMDNLFGESDERTDGSYFTLCDQASGAEIEYMSRQVYVGDELITGDNQHYRVVKLEGERAYCKLLGQRTPSAFTASGPDEAVQVNGSGKYQAVAIYATHSDESYVPTSGTESKRGDGDILDVASVIAQELESKGVEVLHSGNVHDPHDVNAYQRSRKTAAELLQGAPAAIIDVHRDGIPDPNYYATTLNGQDATQIRLVVGKQNQNSEANIAFAERMKAFYDEKKPGLIKSIYMAKGNYNQDMAPNSVLLEVGTHTNTLSAAENGAKEFAQVLPEFLGIASNETRQAPPPEANKAAEKTASGDSGGMSKSILILLGLAVGGGLLFMLISKGSLMGKK